jgi:3-hydroxybutyryl-CoA dehydratase
MNEINPVSNFAVGTELSGTPRVVTAERIQWYDSGMLSAGRGELSQVGANIHTDDEFAKEQGLPAVIADGMMMTNWCQNMLLGYFGVDYVERGELRTKFIKPVFLGATIFPRARVLSIDRQSNGDVYSLDVWCDDENGVKVTDGEARVTVAAPSE